MSRRSVAQASGTHRFRRRQARDDQRRLDGRPLRDGPTDRRVVYAALTPAGRAKIEEAALVHARDLAEVFAPFSPQERGVLDRLLDRLRPDR